MTEKSFASRWAERKRKVQAEEIELEQEGEVESTEIPEIEDVREDADILAELGLKDPEDMQQGDDFSVFMKINIPERIRRRALRKLWSSNPVLANVDGLNDYDGDFTDAALSSAPMKTAYEVGKGYAAKLLREAEQELERSTVDSAENPVISDVDGAETAPDEILEASSEVAESDELAKLDDDEHAAQPLDEPVIATRKRMTFSFE